LDFGGQQQAQLTADRIKIAHLQKEMLAEILPGQKHANLSEITLKRKLGRLVDENYLLIAKRQELMENQMRTV
jgi:hypothetical protein